MDSFSNLQNRGFVKQSSNEGVLRDLLSKTPVVFYIGFDPTADSLHVGSLVPIMAMANLQRDGHIPICVIGGATTLIGDPSGKTEMRRMMSVEEIDSNGQKILSQLKRYLTLDLGKGIMVNNADWCVGLKYIDFLREIGRYFKVNEMIRAESYRARLERQEGLSFIEFNYQLLQAYDFLVLHDRHNCILQMGGDDQWGNIIAGIGLVRQLRKKEVYAVTFPLLETAGGKKMGKTESGAIWLDAKRTTPFDFYQYWINTDDRDVIKFLKLFTFLSLEEIKELENLKGADLRKAKELLAFEATKLAHGSEEAEAAVKASRSLFGSGTKTEDGIPSINLERTLLAREGVSVTELFYLAGLASSKSAARRLVEQGGAYLNDQRVASCEVTVTEADVKGGVLLLRQGKKNYCRVVLR
ncbi:MAG: tyrosine--tRNA ligase [bacterium]|nr:tyrosine--tRNA ligase [bacterium]